MLQRLTEAARRVLSYSSGHLWVAAAAYFTVALAAVLLDDPTRYIVDNRFEQFVNPWQRVWNWFFVWDGSRGLGDVREDMWPGTTLPVGVLRALGTSVATSVRVWHAMCLATAATGVVAVVRVFRPRIGAAHLLAGLFAGFGPFSATFLVPSNLYAMYALCPWLLVVCGRGLTEPRRWRWPALFALIIFAAGNADPPGLLYAFVPAVVFTLYVVGIERTTAAWAAVHWWIRAAVLGAGCSAWAITKTYLAWSRLDQRLSQTELVDTAAETSSWPEVLRGLGHWVSYFVSGGQPVRPQGVEFFTNWLVVGATFVVPVLALVGLWLLRWRPRVLFGALLAVSLILTVGGFGRPQPPPLGAALLWSLENVTLLSGLRNTYKAAGGLAIGSAVLAGVTLFAHTTRGAGRQQARRTGVLMLGVVAVLGGSFPFWSANLYHPDLRSGPIPDYWHDALAALDDLPAGGRTLIVPATSRSKYRWGHVGDDIFDAHLQRPHAIATGVPLSGRHGADLVEVISRWSVDPVHEPGVLGVMAQRLGITEIVVRNDLDWQSSSIPRPGRFDGLRNDPDFERIATFGEQGKHVVDAEDTSADAERERRLPPVEIYRVGAPTGLVQSRPVGRNLFVSGDASAWPSLVNAGVLHPSDVIRYTGDGAAAASADDVRVITDTARRRARTILNYEPTYSHTLAAEQDLGRPVPHRFENRPDASSVAWVPDATAIDGDVTRIGGFRPGHRPAAAFDEDPATAWQLPRFEARARRTVFVSLREPTSIDAISVRALMGVNGPTVRRVRVRLSEGEISVNIDASGFGSARFEPRATSFVEIFAADIDGLAAQVGISEIAIPGLDLREFIQAPTDALELTTGAQSSQRPTMYVFRRVREETNAWQAAPGTVPEEEERVLRRRFFIDTPASFEIGGTVRLDEVGDDIVQRLVGDDLPTRLRSSGSGWLAVDGDEATGWPARRDESLTVSAPHEIRRLEIISMSDSRWLPPAKATVRAGGEDYGVVFRTIGCDGASCRSRAVVDLREPVTRVVINGVRGARPDGRSPAHLIAEVVVNSDANDTPVAESPLSPKCRDLGVVVSGPGGAESIHISLDGTLGDLLHGEPIRFSACETLSTTRGWHLLDAPPGLVESLVLSSPRISTAPVGHIVPVDIARHGRQSIVASNSSESQSARVVVLANSYSDRWVLSVDGASSGRPVAIDGLNGWLVDGGGEQLEFHYRDQRVLTAMVVLSLIAVGTCLVLIGGGRKQREGEVPRVQFGSPTREITLGVPPHRAPRRAWLAGVAVSGMAYLVLGPNGLLIGAATLVGLMTVPRLTVMVGGAAPLLLLASAVATLLEGDGALSVTYAQQRPTANEFGLVAACYLLVSLFTAAVDARHETTSRQRHRRLRRWIVFSYGGRPGKRNEVVPPPASRLPDGDEPYARLTGEDVID